MATLPVTLPEYLGIINDSSFSFLSYNNQSTDFVRSPFKVFGEAGHSFIIKGTITCCLG
jgi:hypothetical protein